MTAKVTRLRPNAPLTTQQEVAALLDQFTQDMAEAGVDVNAPTE